MSICTSLDKSAPTKTVWMLEGQVWRDIKGRTLIKQMEQVKCIHDALSLRIPAVI